MIVWNIEEAPCGKGVMMLTDETTGVRFVLVFPDIGTLRRFLEDITSGAETAKCGASLEGMSAFVKEFPEMFR